MSLPPFYNPDDSPYRPATADSTWTSAGIEGGNSSTGVGYSSGITSNLTTGDGPAVNDTSLTNSNMGQFKQDFPVLSLSGRHAQFQRPDQLQTLQPTVASGSHMGMFMSSNATTPRQSNFPRDQVDRTPQQSGPTLQQDAANVAPSEPLRLGYMPGSDTGASQQASMSAAQRYASWAWNSAPSHFTTTSAAYGRPMYTGMPMSTSLPPSEALMGMSTSHLGFDATSSTHTSPQRMPHPYESAASHMGAPSSYGYGYYGVGSASSSASSSSKSLIPQQDGYVPMGQLEYSAGDIDSMLGQVSTLYKNANTKKMAEFYRDKWARIWLTCNYGLKPSIQISIPRTILHESYRRTCESFGLEPLQAASFGKVLRSQFPDVAQRRLGGRGKTRFHYCGFGTSNEREAFQVKSLLEDEKAGRLQLSAGISAEFANESKSKAKSEGHEPDASSSSSVLAASAAATRQQRSLSFATSGSSSTSANTPMASGPLTMGDDRMAASAFATLNSAVSNTVSTLPGAGTPSSGTQDSFQQTLPPSFPGSGGNGGMPRRHTVSHSGPGPNDVAFLPNLTSQPHASAFSFGSGVGSGVGAGLPGSSAYDTSFGSGSQTEDHSSFASQLNSPASSLHAYYHGHGNEQRGDWRPGLQLFGLGKRTVDAVAAWTDA
ncbi:hypothetical protein BCV70DRAFT_206878 [Testicularia cyperi]|uniref:RFX-type winged-helix domain-containing protein n=1 Tax=Testicularia cyperi TaxID=1882483 RepID=A0A317XRI4_9BASI|nr:hypothetical protein BCV70DRAFT_206878 [Testicularia cyperi]